MDFSTVFLFILVQILVYIFGFMNYAFKVSFKHLGVVNIRADNYKGQFEWCPSDLYVDIYGGQSCSFDATF